MLAMHMAVAAIALALVTTKFTEVWPWLVLAAPILPEKYARCLAATVALTSIVWGKELTEFKLATALAVAVAI